MMIGYARVSSDGQKLDGQIEQLKAAGAEQIFHEIASGAKTDRARLSAAIRRLEPGSTLTVCRLDRLARSTRDLLNILSLVQSKGANFRSLNDEWANTTTAQGRLMLTVLGGLAEFERHLLLARTAEGRERARSRGVKMGRKLKLTPHQQAEAIARLQSGEATRDIGRSYNVSHSTISRLRNAA